ncbi:MAG: DUF6029 family protein [Bacteroidota bacterium]
MKKIALLFSLSLIAVSVVKAQGTLSGDLMMNTNFFQRDSSIKAANNPLYDNYLSGGEAWLGLRYSYKGFTATIRADVFNNSNLKDPQNAMSGFGLGAWTLSKEFKDLKITAGYIYDQIGSGILFRAYEDRGLLIDNALVGVHLKYKLNEHIILKGFTGQQKNVFNRYEPIVKGISAEGDYSIGKLHLLPGVGAINRTIDQTSMEAITSTINGYALGDRFEPMYNMYGYTFYNTLNIGDFSWYAEGSYKTHEAIIGLDGQLHDHDGNVEYTTLGYARKGIALNVTGKRTENFVMRTSPNEKLLLGILNWQPLVSHIRAQRLMARYTPASQDISEQAAGADLLLAPNETTSFIINYTYINTLDNVKLYRETYLEGEYRGIDKCILQGGLQILEYNQKVYQVNSAKTIVNAVTPFAEFTYRINSKQSIRTEWEYMSTKQDYGSWIFGLLEFNVAPKWSFSVSDMYNIDPYTDGLKLPSSEGKHYYNFFAAYTKGPHRFTIAYVKQVDGINCTGGVCRYEPAFSGIRTGITSSF